MRWQDIDLSTGWWLIPAELSKNADPHRVPLTPMALKILERREKTANRDDLYVFSNHRRATRSRNSAERPPPRIISCPRCCVGRNNS